MQNLADVASIISRDNVRAAYYNVYIILRNRSREPAGKGIAENDSEARVAAHPHLPTLCTTAAQRARRRWWRSRGD
jgi:hypothetical protein